VGGAEIRLPLQAVSRAMAQAVRKSHASHPSRFATDADEVENTGVWLAHRAGSGIFMTYSSDPQRQKVRSGKG
jgi:hypothetical protein